MLCRHDYEKDKTMQVHINFRGPFHGKLYTKGYFSVGGCESHGNGGFSAVLEFPVTSCGTVEVETVSETKE